MNRIRQNSRTCRKSRAFYARRALGGHHDHRHSDRALAAGRADRPRSRAAGAMLEQSQAALTRMLATRAVGRLVSHGRVGYAWVGDPDRAFGVRQPGGWCYNILPFIEQQPLHDLGLGATSDAQRVAANVIRVATPLKVFTCPSRRPPTVLPVGCVSFYCTNMAGHFSTCYVANAGECDMYLITSVATYAIPGSFADGDNPTFWTDTPAHPHNSDFGRFNGVVITRSTVKNGRHYRRNLEHLAAG